MKVLGLNLVKSSILDLVHTTKDTLYICTYGYDFTSLEMFEFVQLIERKAMINIIAGKELPSDVKAKLAKLYNIRVYHLPKLHAKIYLNEDDAIVSSCDFGNLTVPRLYECGVRFSKHQFKSEHQKLEDQMKVLISEATLVLPLLPFKHDKGIDLREFL